MKPVVIFILIAICFPWQNKAQSSPAEPENITPVKIVYFIPSDMEAIPDRDERLGRVMRCVQDFYRKEMERNGYGPLTFALEWTDPRKLKLYEVNGKKKQTEYGRNDAYIVLNEVRDALKTKYGIDANKEYLVIFQLLLQRDGNRSIELGPYVGSGGSLSGTAWVYDDDRLDADSLISKAPGGYYNRPCSLGQFNTHYIGGVAHEMGHAFGLPHVCESSIQRATMGSALMGNGNHTFGKELRNEGLGTFLSQTSALRLTTVRAFVGNLPNAGRQGDWNVEELTAKEENHENGRRTIALSGRITASPKLLGIIAYNDNLNIPADYDAKAWMTKNIEEGRFSLTISELEPVPYQLRIVGIHENGATSQLSVNYEVTSEKINFERLNAIVAETHLLNLFRNKKTEQLETISKKPAENETIRLMAKHLIKLLSVPTLVKVAALPANVSSTDLTDAVFETEETGWLGVHRGKAPEDVFLRIGDQFFESGLYAHAPSRFIVDLAGKWETLTIGYGLQDNHEGPVRFIIRGNDKELFRSQDIKDHRVENITISIANIQKLELHVESAVPGNNGAWGIWVNPIISRK